MIKYNNSNINDWNFGEDNIIKVYRNNAVCYYKITGTPAAQTPCYAVVDNISQYLDTEFEDVFNLADEKWYKLNNLNQYEQYGIYGEGRNITYYDGKLTIDDGYEYMYSGGSWVNLGEVSGGTITIKSPEYIERTSSYNGRINLDYVWKTNTKLQFKFYSTNNGGGAMISEPSQPDNNDCRVLFASTSAYFDYGSDRINWSSNGMTNTLYEYEYGNYYIKNLSTSTTKTGTTFSVNRTNSLYLGIGNSDYFRTYYVKFYEDNTLVKDFIPWTDTNGNFGLYERVSNTIYSPDSGSFTASTVWTDVEVGTGYTYPIEYVVREDPPDNLVFSSMEEAEEYECPWYGMSALIAGEDYMFCEGNEWLTKYSYVEVAGDYICDNGDKYKKMQEYDRQADATMSPTSNYVKGDLIESGSPDCSFNGKWIAYYADESVAYSAECSSSTAITKTEVRSGSYQLYKKVIIGDCVNRIREAFQQCTSMTDLEIGTGVTESLYYAFEDCTALTAATWYATGLTNSQDGGFQRCSSLQKLVMYSTSVPNISITFFRNVPSTLIIYVPDSAISAYQSKTNWKNYTIKGHSELPT